jgi:hypothetical protein
MRDPILLVLIHGARYVLHAFVLTLIVFLGAACSDMNMSAHSFA